MALIYNWLNEKLQHLHFECHLVLNSSKCLNFYRHLGKARCNLFPWLATGQFLTPTLDYNNQSLCPRKLWPYFFQHDKPVFSGKFLHQASRREEFSQNIFCWGGAREYLLPPSSISLLCRHRSFRSYLRLRWGTSNNGSQNTRFYILYPGSGSPLGGYGTLSYNFLPLPRNSLASSPWRSYLRPGSRLLL